MTADGRKTARNRVAGQCVSNTKRTKYPVPLSLGKNAVLPKGPAVLRHANLSLETNAGMIMGADILRIVTDFDHNVHLRYISRTRRCVLKDRMFVLWGCVHIIIIVGDVAYLNL